MKTYKTWEVIKMLSENKSLKFKREPNLIVGVDERGYVSTLNKHSNYIVYLGNDYKWQLIQEPVDFMTAINSGKRIKSELWVNYDCVEDVMNLLDGMSEKIFLEFINGKWFIEVKE